MAVMSQPEDIDKLLRELEAMNSGAIQGSGAASPERRKSEPAPARKGSGPTTGGRVAWTGAGAIGAGAVGGITGTVLAFLPWVSTLSTAIGAALGGAVMAAVSGPPGWFDRED